MKRALTLIEVVAATVLFTLIVLACVPLLRQARSVTDSADSGARVTQLAELERAVDDLLRQRPGLLELVLEAPGGSVQTWNVGEQVFAAEARLGARVVAQQGERRSSHAWVIFRVGGLDVPRWLRMPIAHSEAGTGS